MEGPRAGLMMIGSPPNDGDRPSDRCQSESELAETLEPGPAIAWRLSVDRYQWRSTRMRFSVISLAVFLTLVGLADFVSRWQTVMGLALLLGAEFLASLSVGRAWFGFDADHVWVHRRGETRCYPRDRIVSFRGENTNDGPEAGFVVKQMFFAVERPALRWLPAMHSVKLREIKKFVRELDDWRLSGVLPRSEGGGLRLRNATVLQPRLGWVVSVYAACAIGASAASIAVVHRPISWIAGTIAVMLFVLLEVVAFRLCRAMWWASPEECGGFGVLLRRVQTAEVVEVRRFRFCGVDRLVVRTADGTTLGRWSLLFAAASRRDRDRFAEAARAVSGLDREERQT